jgi:hypothetical protein
MTMSDEKNSPDEGTLLDMDDEASPPPPDVVLRRIERSIARSIARGVDPAIARAAYGLTSPPDPLAAGGAPSLGPQVATDPEAPAADR